MNKNMTIGIIILVFIAGFSIGYLSSSIISIPQDITNNNTPEDNDDTITSDPALLDQFSGTWIATETSADVETMEGILYYTWTFYENESLHMIISHENESAGIKEWVNTWQKFELRDDLLYVNNPNGGELDYEYQFSSDKSELTLIRQGNPLTFTKSS